MTLRVDNPPDPTPYVGGHVIDENGNRLPIESASVTITSNTITTIVAGQAGNKVRVLGFYLSVSSSNTLEAKFVDSSGGGLWDGQIVVSAASGDPRASTGYNAPEGGYLFENVENNNVRVNPGGNPSSFLNVTVYYVRVPV